MGAQFALDGEDGEFELLDSKTFDPSDLSGVAYTLSQLRAKYPDGDYEFAITDSCGTTTVDVDFTFTPTAGSIRTLFPAHQATINTGTPALVVNNTCTACNTRDFLIANGSGTIELDYEEDFTLGLRPNAIAFVEFFDQGENVEIDSLPADDYLLISVIGTSIKESNVAGCGAGTCDYYATNIEVDISNFTVSADTTTNADVFELDLELLELSSKPSEFPFALGFYAVGELDGNNLGAPLLYLPNVATPISFDDDGGGEFSFFSGPFSTRSEAVAVLPATDGSSKYVLMVDGKRASALLDFVPVEADGRISLTTIESGDTIIPTPTFDLTNTCTNCSAIYLWLEDIATQGDSYSNEAEQLDFEEEIVLGDLSFTVPDDFEEEGALPLGDFFLGTESLNETFFGAGEEGSPVLVSTAGTDDFTYFAGEGKNDVIVVTVPEPALLAVQLASLACIGLMAHARRKS